MKNLFFVSVVFIAFVCCNQTTSEGEQPVITASDDNSVFNNQLLPSADTSINISNAYDSLFVDTAAINAYLADNKVSTADAQAIVGFYNMRNYQFAWFAPDGMTEQGRGFWNAYTYARTHGQKDSANSKALIAKMDTILEIDTLIVAQHDTALQKIEIALTHRFINYYRNTDRANLIHQLPLTYLLPVRKSDPLAMADSILSLKTTVTDSTNAPYLALRQILAHYDSIADKGGWQPIVASVALLKKGKSDPVVTAIKRRLALTGEYMAGDTTPKYSDSLAVAIQSFQERHGFRPDGIVTDSQIMVMNIPVDQRIQQILVNLNRMAWMPPQVEDNFIAVNIPEFMLKVYQDDSIPIKMEVVVGKEGTNTMMFTGDLNQVVFNPTWRLPASIVKAEILPALQKDPNYLKKKNMEIVGRNDTLPEIKQLPGPGNALGRVKFLFPNTYDIYLHDTDAKDLFAQNKRAFSHGCIRVSDPQGLSEYVLKENNNWTPDKIRAAMTGNKEQVVPVKKSLPVVITYFTAWVDSEGNVHFRDDIYQHDKRTAGMMFKANDA